jgi:hypothetical protein
VTQFQGLLNSADLNFSNFRPIGALSLAQYRVKAYEHCLNPNLSNKMARYSSDCNQLYQANTTEAQVFYEGKKDNSYYKCLDESCSEFKYNNLDMSMYLFSKYAKDSMYSEAGFNVTLTNDKE